MRRYILLNALHALYNRFRFKATSPYSESRGFEFTQDNIYMHYNTGNASKIIKESDRAERGQLLQIMAPFIAILMLLPSTEAAAQTGPEPDFSPLPEVDLVDENSVSSLSGRAVISFPLIDVPQHGSNPPLSTSFNFDKAVSWPDVFSCPLSGVIPVVAQDIWISSAIYRSLSIHGRRYPVNSPYFFSQIYSTPFGDAELNPVESGQFVSGQNGNFYAINDGPSWQDIIYTAGGIKLIYRDGPIYQELLSSAADLRNIELNRVEFPDGEVWTYVYQPGSVRAIRDCPNGQIEYLPVPRLRYVWSNKGYGLHIDYARASSVGLDHSNIGAWLRVTAIRRYSKATVQCDEGTGVNEFRCPDVMAVVPSVTFDYASDYNAVVIHADGVSRRVEFGRYDRVINGQEGTPLITGPVGANIYDRHVKSIELLNVPGSRTRYWTAVDGGTDYSGTVSTPNPDIGFPSFNRRIGYVYRVDRDGQTWSYRYDLNGTEQIESRQQVIDPKGSSSRNEGNAYRQLSIQRDELGRTTRYEHDLVPGACSAGILWCRMTRLLAVQYPEGDRKQFEYDSLGRPIRVTSVPKPATGASSIVQSVGYFDDCVSQPVNCYRPTSVTDANGNVTSYTYDAAHGGVLTMTEPVVDGVSPVTRYYYVQREAWLRSGAGYAKSGEPIWLKSEERSCRTSTLDPVAGTCSAGAGDLVRTLYDFGPDSGPNNLWLRGVAVEADGQTLRTCYQYDQLGRRIAETRPLGTGATCP